MQFHFTASENFADPRLWVLLGTLCLAGCSHQPSAQDMAAGIQVQVAKIEELRDPKALKEARQDLYAFGPAALRPLQEPILSVFDHAQPQLIAVYSAIPDEQTWPILLQVLHSKFPERRRQALYGLSLLPRPVRVNGVLILTKSTSASDREWALYALNQTKDLTSKPAFLALANDPDANVRMQAARGLRLFPGVDSVGVLERLMDDKASGVALEATLSLGRIDAGNAKVKGRLERFSTALKDGTTDQREEVAQVLGESQTPTGEAMLAGLLRDPDPRIRAVAAGAYVRLGHVHDPTPLLRSLQTDPDPHVRMRATHAIALLHIPEAVPIFRKLVFGKDRNAARAAAAALKDMCDPMSQGILQRMLKVPDLEIRRMGAVGQMRMAVPKPDSFPLIDEILADSASDSAEKRRSAANYMSDLPGPRVEAALDTLEHDPNPSVRVAAMDARKKQMGMSRVLPDILEHPQPSWIDPVR